MITPHICYYCKVSDISKRNSVLMYFNIKLARMKMSNVGIQIQKTKTGKELEIIKQKRIDIAKNFKEIRKHNSIRVNSKNF